MLFHDSEFLFTFLPLALLLHRAALLLGPREHYGNVPRLVLFGLTLVFYGYHNPWWLIPFFICISFDFLWARLLTHEEDPRRRTLLCTLSIVQNLSMLGAFKYGTWSWELPPGISFYTFESLSFVIDVYRRQVLAPTNPGVFFGFIGMFPRFVAGPIVRYKEMVAQFGAYRGMQLSAGLFLFVYGLFLKLCFADSFRVFIPYAFRADAAPDALAAWAGVIAYAMRIYFDFAGYSLMAIGLGRCFGFQFPTNFNRPYLATSLQDFWRRWHITLSSWLRDYVYVPLGGSRGGTLGTYRNVWLTMILGGIWHGSTFNFLIWGAWHGAVLCAERALPRPLPAWLSRGTTLLCVLVGWVWFRAETVPAALEVLKAMCLPFAPLTFSSDALFSNPVAFGFCLLGLVHCFVIEPRMDAGELERIEVLGVRHHLASVGMASLCLFFGTSQFIVPFLYFQF